MIEQVEKTKKSARRWKSIAALFLVSCRISSSYVPVEPLTSPVKKSACDVCIRPYSRRKRCRWEYRDSLHFAIRVEEEAGINGEAAASFSYPDDLEENTLLVSKPLTNGKENGQKANGLNRETVKIEEPSPIADVNNSTTKPVRYSVLLKAEELVKKNGATKPQSSREVGINGDSGGRNFTEYKSADTNLAKNNKQEKEEKEEPTDNQSKRSWSRRHARTLEEGIRRETAPELYSLLNEAQIEARTNQGRRYVERTFMGLINALAAEHEDLDIDITASEKSPIWRKNIKEVRITFSRLGFKPIRMGGNDIQDENPVQLSLTQSADEAFDQIDKDKSGTLDQEELAEALSMISDLEADKDSCIELASKLIALYDFNGDGYVDREEYQKMVEDMAVLSPEPEKTGPLNRARKSVQTISKGISEKAAQVASAVRRNKDNEEKEQLPVKEYGSIVLSNVKLDLRRLIFGGFPIIKKVSDKKK